ncbi:hypothetical protein [Pseudomonas aeruginosa]|uniref:hypothetical protein n=1 Tax=Pseudomonas aeruginosa TaxID=287 RepID=UPI0012A79CE2|nr:hypothetical protein [Pseudomonas aeruginosa]EIU1654122.1 hypothetical protein [Pseudomonas aeruginosa]MCX2521293.1 hypothetical protein [Pseudomonas aeruginosa]MDU0778298.1 hypothetical protein [Pseudomonas aeruginosa]QGJ34103.1 hypothetical protein FOZ66_17640 [Pseudomonas aeruginosa]HBN8626090.1 hypothetical protein [Pseudomonas aeruginosa]
MQMHAQQGGSAAKASTSHFHGTTNIEEYIRDMASRGFSRRAVSQALGMRSQKFKELLELLPEMDWVPPRQSWDCLRANQEKKGRKCPMTEGRLRAVTAARRVAMAKHTRYTAFGVTATLPELVRQFGQVTVASVRIRLAKGMPLEQALTSARSDPLGRKTAPADHHPWRQEARQGVVNHHERQAAAMQERVQGKRLDRAASLLSQEVPPCAEH